MKTQILGKTLAAVLLVSFFPQLAPPVAAANPPLPIYQYEQMASRGFDGFQNSGVWSMQWWNGKLYVGTVRNWYCFSQAWFYLNYPDLWNWPPKSPHQCTDDIRELPLQAEIWRYTPGTDLWEMVHRSPEVPIPGEPGYFTGQNVGYRSATVFEEPGGTEALYVGGVTANLLWQPMPPPRLLRSVDGTTFAPVPQDPGTILGDLGTGQASFRSMAVYKDRLYILNSDIQGKGAVLEATNPAGGNNNFRWITPDGMLVFEMAVFNGFLYLGLVNEEEGYSVVKTDCTGTPPYRFFTVIPPGGSRTRRASSAVVSMHAFDGRLYIGTDRPCEIIRVNPDDTWDLVVGKPRRTAGGYKRPLSGIGGGFGYGFNYHIWRMQEHDGVLYVGTYDETTKYLILFDALEDTPGANPFLDPLRDRAGFDLFATKDGQHFTRLTIDGFGDLFEQGIRNFASTPLGLFVGTVNTIEGLMVWRGPPGGAAGGTSNPRPPEWLEVEPESGRPLLSWEPSANAVKYRVFRSDKDSNFDLKEVGATDKTFFTDKKAKSTGHHDYCVVAERASGGMSRPSNIVTFPSDNTPASFQGTANALGAWKASKQTTDKLAAARSLVIKRKYDDAIAQLEALSQDVLLDPSMPSWREEDSVILLGQLARRVLLVRRGLVTRRDVMWGF